MIKFFCQRATLPRAIRLSRKYSVHPTLMQQQLSKDCHKPHTTTIGNISHEYYVLLSDVNHDNLKTTIAKKTRIKNHQKAKFMTRGIGKMGVSGLVRITLFSCISFLFFWVRGN